MNAGTARTWSLCVGSDPRLPLRLRWGSGPVTRWTANAPLTAPATRIDRVVIHAESVDWLRRSLAEPAAAAVAREVVVHVRRWRPPRPDWSGRLGPLPGVRRHRADLPHGGGAALVTVELREPAPLRTILSAVHAVLGPVRPLPRVVSADVLALAVAPVWLPPSARHLAHAGALLENPEIRAHDVVLAGAEATVEAGPELAAVVVRTVDGGARIDDRVPTVLIDSAVANPIGRDQPYGPEGSTAVLDWTGTGWRITGSPGRGGPTGRVFVEGTVDGLPLTAEQISAIRKIAVIRAEPSEAAPVAQATILAQLAATGAVLDLPELPHPVAERLASPLRNLLRTPLPDPTAEAMEWEIRSVRQRSTALRGHASAFALGQVTAGTFAGLTAPPSVSAVLVTRRPDYLADAVRYIADQTYPELEIVLCLHGIELAPDLRARVAACGRPVEIFNAPAGLSFGEVMGAATARARGSLVTKFDDDDVYGPEHVWDLVLTREYSGATLVGKAAEFVYLQALGVTVRRRAVPPETYGPPVAGGTMLISRGDLEEVGGWRPVPRSVDRGLMDRVLRAGGLIYRTHPLGYLYERRTGGHTWDVGLDYFLRRSGQQWDGLPRYAEFGTVRGESAVGH